MKHLMSFKYRMFKTFIRTLIPFMKDIKWNWKENIYSQLLVVKYDIFLSAPVECGDINNDKG